MLRINFSQIEPEAEKPIYSMTEYVKKSRIEESLRNLIYIRASQINGCAYCLDMHTQDARVSGEREQRINCLSVWKESPFYTKRERAALELTEAVTRLYEKGVPDELYNRVRKEFGESEFIALITTINIINCWNRLMIACGGSAGSYKNKDLNREIPEFFSDSD